MINLITLILHFAVGFILLKLATKDLGVVHKCTLFIMIRVSAALWWLFKLWHIKNIEDEDIDLMIAQLALFVLLFLLSSRCKNLIKLIS